MKQQRAFSYAKYGYLFSIPFIVVFCIFNLYPTIYTAILGFTDCKGLGNTEWKFLVEEPFKNFEQILANPSFKTALLNTFKIWIMNFIPQISLALLLTAWFTSRRNVLKGQSFFKVVFYMPNIITAASVAILFNALFGYPMGPVNDLVVSWGLSDKPFAFVDNKIASQCIVAFIQFWQWYGYTMIILISGVLGINPEIYEAAEIDGANDIQMFFKVTIPNLKTILLYTLITSLIGGLTMYDIPRLFNDGKPANATLTATMFIHNQAFKGSYMYNRASAASLLIFIVVAVCSAFVFLLMRDKNERR